MLLRHMLVPAHPLSSQQAMNQLSEQLVSDLEDVLSATTLSSVQRACSLALAGDEVRGAMDVLGTRVMLETLRTCTKHGPRFRPEIVTALPATSSDWLTTVVEHFEAVYALENKVIKKVAAVPDNCRGLGCADTLLSRDMPRAARQRLDKRLEAFVCVLAVNLAALRKTPLSPESADACLKLIEDAQIDQVPLLKAVLSWDDESKGDSFDLQRALDDHADWRKSVQHFLTHATIERVNPYNDGDKQ
jgi:hypothetical protein